MRKKVGQDPGPSHSEIAFNPSKTFGGQRARMMFMKGDGDEEGGKKEGYNGYGGSRTNISGTTLLPGLEKLCKQFAQNQQRIEGMLESKAQGVKF